MGRVVGIDRVVGSNGRSTGCIIGGLEDAINAQIAEKSLIVVVFVFSSRREILDFDGAGWMAVPVTEPNGTENAVDGLTTVEAVVDGMVDGSGWHPTEMLGSTGEFHS